QSPQIFVLDPDHIVTKEIYWPNSTFKAAGKSATLYVPKVDLDADSDYDGGIDEEDDSLEESVGGLAVIGAESLAPLNLSFGPEGLTSGTLTLSAAACGGKIAVWPENNTNGTPFTLPKIWTVGTDTIPPTVYLQGVETSAVPRDVALELRLASGGVTCCDTVRVTVVRMALVPDYDRDGIIDGADRLRAATNEVFRFWINDDNDNGAFAEHEENVPDTDQPDQFECNCLDHIVNGRSDLLDFMIVWLNLGGTLSLLPPEDGYLYRIKSIGIAFAETDLSRYNATDCLRTDYNKCGPQLNAPAPSAPLLPADPFVEVSTPLSAEFLAAVRADGDKGVLMVEGTRDGACMELEVVDADGHTILSAECPVRFYEVENMYRWVNLRSAAGGAVERPTGGALQLDPLGQPDPGDCEAHFVFVHGYNVSEGEARAWNAEVFKRLYQSGMNARFTAVTWYGNESQHWITGAGYRSPNYYTNVCHAFETAQGLSAAVASLPGEVKVIAAHSLGNMAVSSAIQDHGLQVTKYFMLNAAVAAECYDASLFNTSGASNPMVHDDWRDYHSKTWSACWHALFDADARATLTWTNRFHAVLPVAYNYYSSGDQVFELNADGTPWPAEGILADVGRYSWQKQELFKGRTASSDLITSSYASDCAGWGFLGYKADLTWWRTYCQDAANALTSDQLRTTPVFHPNPAEMFHYSISLADRFRILAYGIPALSQAAGLAQVGSNEEPVMAEEVDMNALNLHPNGWWRTGDGDLDNRWLHSDLKQVAYYYVYPLFVNLVETGGLK
ncbi:MAG TPA: hypothetical protein PLJ71_22540, partial [Candidatus Hydrogenedentes bacterium]|nr:hypothetical protein [Candidatus Hydrogenedentota bacterium]